MSRSGREAELAVGAAGAIVRLDQFNHLNSSVPHRTYDATVGDEPSMASFRASVRRLPFTLTIGRTPL